MNQMSGLDRRRRKRSLFIRENGICQFCKTPVDPEQACLFHVIPIHYGGTHSLDNLQLMHPSCNRKKGQPNQIVPSLTLEIRRLREQLEAERARAEKYQGALKNLKFWCIPFKWLGWGIAFIRFKIEDE